MSSVKLVWVTPDAEKHIAFCARVSSSYQDNPNIAGLLKYMIREGHWSPFEMADMCLEIRTTRAISHQIIRHKSFSFQEFSQRYAKAPKIIFCLPRRQDLENRQNSIDDMSQSDIDWFIEAQKNVAEECFKWYEEALKKGIAKECARFLLPLNTETVIYMKGNVRSWMHYIELRGANGTQKEHADIVAEIKNIFIEQFPIISEALGWTNNG